MITYLYWFCVLSVGVFVAWGISRYFKMKYGIVGALIVVLIGWSMYTFRYQQYFVKNLGGVMTINIKEGLIHIQATWKDDNLWVENYDPVKKECYFSEYAKGNLLQGQVTLKNCNPLLPNQSPANQSQPNSDN